MSWRSYCGHRRSPVFFLAIARLPTAVELSVAQPSRFQLCARVLRRCHVNSKRATISLSRATRQESAGRFGLNHDIMAFSSRFCRSLRRFRQA
ncbi:hypothetical protein EDD17DRAFT_1599156 [Pisolithus thermaeus]|nr:hypothetical protein EV401DRAFT_1963296 [Pisolithus croceorrhizus]KAI6160666.1 hypothetical protein EDD17DRAFT_1599156 [Pisolithus thermaeus]